MRSEKKLVYCPCVGSGGMLQGRIFVLNVIFILFSLIMFSCGRPVKSTDDGQMYDAEDIDIPVSVSLGHLEDEDMRQLVNAEYEITDETDEDIFIDINSDYYNKYMSGSRFVVPQLAYFENSENVEFLTLNLDVVNNTDESLSVSELDVMVDESRPDTIPVVYMCSTETYSNCMFLVNESWFDWGGLTLSYSIMKEGESFDGNYRESRYIPCFDDYLIIDFFPDMEAMGYDIEGLTNCIRNRNIEYNLKNDFDNNVEPWEVDDSNRFLVFSIRGDDEDFDFFQDKFKPFGLRNEYFDEYVGAATLYGSLKFDNMDFKVDFIAEISLSTPGEFGALSYLNDSFDVELETYGDDYLLMYPYTTVIEPYGSEYIKLIVKAGQSSTHRFKIDIKNDNGLTVRSKNIHFHSYCPKN